MRVSVRLDKAHLLLKPDHPECWGSLASIVALSVSLGIYTMEQRQAAIETCARRLLSRLSSFSWFDSLEPLLFAADECVLAPTRFVMKKGFWHRYREVQSLLQAPNTLVESPINVESGIRFAGVARIRSMDAVVECCRHTREHKSWAILLTRTDAKLSSSEGPTALFPIMFPNTLEPFIDFSAAVTHLCPGGIIILRTSGWFDDPEVAVEAFMTQDRINERDLA